MQIGEFYVIKGYGGYYTPSLYKDHYQKIDIDEYKKQDQKWSKESCERLLDNTSLYPKQEMGYQLRGGVMISLNQQEIKIGDTVKILEVPVTKQHRFVDGVVEGFTNKQVVVRAEMRNRWGDRDDRVVWCYPEQVIVVNWREKK